MALLSTSPQAVLPDCKTRWITFSCTGELLTKDFANRLYSAAQLALVTGKPMDARVNDLKMHHGYCLADRVGNT
jgi:tRNA G37 N-methylase TrmD